jgi:ribosomal protein L32
MLKWENRNMDNVTCPKCGHQGRPEATCPDCGQAANGTATPVQARREKPPRPPELEGVVFEKITPEIEALFGPFNEEEFMAEMREIEENGGAKFEDFIDEIERIANGQE